MMVLAPRKFFDSFIGGMVRPLATGNQSRDAGIDLPSANTDRILIRDVLDREASRNLCRLFRSDLQQYESLVAFNLIVLLRKLRLVVRITEGFDDPFLRLLQQDDATSNKATLMTNETTLNEAFKHYGQGAIYTGKVCIVFIIYI